VLVHVVDMASADPERDFGIIRDELEARDPRLLEKTTLVAANKMDLQPDPAIVAAFTAARERAGMTVVPIAATTRAGLPRLRAELGRVLPDAAEMARPGDPVGVVVHRFDPAESGYSVERGDDGTFVVRGRRIERLAAQTDFAVDESAARFQRELARSGIEDALVRAGVGAGDVVRIGPLEMEWESGGAAWE
jgi:GTP-binding protein